MRAILISTYELGRQPFGLASPAAWLRRDGWTVRCLDTTKEPVGDADLAHAELIGFHLPMHTATRLAAPIIAQARRVNPAARICGYGLYAPLNAAFLRSLGATDVLGGEFEEALADIARELEGGPSEGAAVAPRGRAIPRLKFLMPDRSSLPSLARYASLQLPDGTRRRVGATEASRGCKHLCRHCPVVPVYEGQFRIVQPEVVLADIDQLIAAGAGHITFGDADFLNGPTHAMRIVEALHASHPDVSYDVTIKIEHLLEHRDLLPRLAATNCAFVTSAVESVDDRVLALLRKGHTRDDFVAAVVACRQAGLTLAPTFIAFHPWLTLRGYCDLLGWIVRLDLVEHVAPIQLAIRLLIPQGSKLLDLDAVRDAVDAFDPATLSYRWHHVDRRVDDLQREVAALVAKGAASNRAALFDEICALARERAGLPASLEPLGRRLAVPYIDEPWYCCAEPNPEEMRLV